MAYFYFQEKLQKELSDVKQQSFAEQRGRFLNSLDMTKVDLNTGTRMSLPKVKQKWKVLHHFSKATKKTYIFY